MTKQSAAAIVRAVVMSWFSSLGLRFSWSAAEFAISACPIKCTTGTYPQFLQELRVPLGLRIANGGIAGEISDNGPQQVRDYLDLFPNARYIVIGMGTKLHRAPNRSVSAWQRTGGTCGMMTLFMKQDRLPQGASDVLRRISHTLDPRVSTR